MKHPGYGRYAMSGHMGRHDDALSTPSPAITSERGDKLLDALIGERRFQDVPVKPLGRLQKRPEPVATPGAGSSLSTVPASHGRRGASYFHEQKGRGHR